MTEQTNSGKVRPSKGSQDGRPGVEYFMKVATDLSRRVRDARDELNILRTITKYQGDVQAELYGKNAPQADKSAAYISKDIDEMDKVANDLQSAVRISTRAPNNMIDQC